MSKSYVKQMKANVHGCVKGKNIIMENKINSIFDYESKEELYIVIFLSIYAIGSLTTSASLVISYLLQ